MVLGQSNINVLNEEQIIFHKLSRGPSPVTEADTVNNSVLFIPN